MCHPGQVDDTLRAESGYAHEREEELSILTHDKALEAVEQSDIYLTTYRNAWNPPVRNF